VSYIALQNHRHIPMMPRLLSRGEQSQRKSVSTAIGIAAEILRSRLKR